MSQQDMLRIKRLIRERKNLLDDPMEYFDACPDENDLNTWYFVIRLPHDGDKPSQYVYTENGVTKPGLYFGKIMLPPDYPCAPPDFMMLTPSGRFETGRKLCLTNTGYHTNQWSANWSIQKMLLGFISVVLSDAKEDSGLAHLHLSKKERETFAKQSSAFNKKHYENVIKLFPRFYDEAGNPLDKVIIPDKKTKNTVENKTIESPEKTKVETKVEPNVETKVEPKVEPNVETKIETKVEPKIEIPQRKKLFIDTFDVSSLKPYVIQSNLPQYTWHGWKGKI